MPRARRSNRSPTRDHLRRRSRSREFRSRQAFPPRTVSCRASGGSRPAPQARRTRDSDPRGCGNCGATRRRESGDAYPRRPVSRRWDETSNPPPAGRGHGPGEFRPRGSRRAGARVGSSGEFLHQRCGRKGAPSSAPVPPRTATGTRPVSTIRSSALPDSSAAPTLLSKYASLWDRCTLDDMP